MAPITIHHLPNEILGHIFLYLDRPPPSEYRLHDQPSVAMLQTVPEEQDLKAASLICKRWRVAALPLLFRNFTWRFDRLELSLMEQTDDPASAVDILVFLRRHNLTSYVDTLTLIVNDGLGSNLSASNIALSETGHEQQATFSEDHNWLWRALFEHLDPLRFTLIASPRVLAFLLSRMLFLGDAWSFAMPRHVLSLSRTDRKLSTSKYVSPRTNAGTSAVSPSQASSTQPKRVPCDLFSIRPWYSILLNEGSSTHVYKTYEFFLKRPPSILGALLGAEEFPNDKPLLTRATRDLSYVGIFPLSSHFNMLVQNIPPLDRLFVQLVPRNDILQRAEETRNIDISDLWMERNNAYSMLFRELFDADVDSPWLGLKTFESGDAADKEAWELAVQYVQFSGVRGWKVESEGVFVREENTQGPFLGGSQSVVPDLP